jgi:hypothetical protein
MGGHIEVASYGIHMIAAVRLCQRYTVLVFDIGFGSR